MATKQVFLSHSSMDVQFARALARTLADLDQVEIDQVSTAIRSADQWTEVIRQSLIRADEAIFLVTPNYVRKPWFIAEWAACWLRGIPCHLLLIDVDPADLPDDVMTHQQYVAVDVQTSELAARLLERISPTTPLPRRVTMAGDIKDIVGESAPTWAPARWEGMVEAIGDGRATLRTPDIQWSIESGQDAELVKLLQTSFAHPSLVHQVAQTLLASGSVGLAVGIFELLAPNAQRMIFSALLERNDIDEAIRIAEIAEGRETRRRMAQLAIQADQPRVASAIAQAGDSAYDKRVIAEWLFDRSEFDLALGLMRSADKNYEKRIFIKKCIERGATDIAMELVDTMTSANEVRRVGEALIDAGDIANITRVIHRIDKNYEKRILAIYAIRSGNLEVVQEILKEINPGAEIRQVAEEYYRCGEKEWAIRTILLAQNSNSRRVFAVNCLLEDKEALLEVGKAIDNESVRRGLAELMMQAGDLNTAGQLAESLEKKAERTALAWFALERNHLDLVHMLVDERLDVVTRNAILAAVGAFEADAS